MSEDKKIQNLIINKLTKEQYNSIETKSNNELYDIVDDAHFTAEEINELLAVKQDKLTAGDGIEILEDGTINNTKVSAEWGNIQGDLSAQTDLQELVSTKVDKQEGKSLISDTEIERLASVDNYDDTTVLSDINDLKINKQDKLTAGTGIKISEDNVISATDTQGGGSTWGSIDGDIKSQEDLQDELNTRGSKLEYTGSTLSLLNSNDEVLNSVNITSGGTTVEVDIATVDKTGVVKPDGETILIKEDGTISTKDIVFPIATIEDLGVIKPDGDTISVDDNGTISANIPDVDTSNLANIDLSNITDLGLQNVLSTLANVAKTGSYNDLTDKPTIPNEYTLPTASTDVLGGVKVDGTTISILDGVISVVTSSNTSDIELIQTTDANCLVFPAGFKIYWGRKIFTKTLTSTSNSQTLNVITITLPTPLNVSHTISRGVYDTVTSVVTNIYSGGTATTTTTDSEFTPKPTTTTLPIQQTLITKGDKCTLKNLTWYILGY